MDDSDFTTTSRSLYAELSGVLRSAWRRCAKQTSLDARGPTERSEQRRRAFAVGPALSPKPLLAVRALTVAVPLIVAGAAAVAAATADSEEFDPVGPQCMQRQAALQAFRAQRYATAYGRFAQLADEGDVPSALIALAMVRHGPSMFGSEWSATPGQLERWSAMAAQDVRERGLLIADHDRGE